MSKRAFLYRPRLATKLASRRRLPLPTLRGNRRKDPSRRKLNQAEYLGRCVGKRHLQLTKVRSAPWFKPANPYELTQGNRMGADHVVDWFAQQVDVAFSTRDESIDGTVDDGETFSTLASQSSHHPLCQRAVKFCNGNRALQPP